MSTKDKYSSIMLRREDSTILGTSEQLPDGSVKLNTETMQEHTMHNPSTDEYGSESDLDDLDDDEVVTELIRSAGEILIKVDYSYAEDEVEEVFKRIAQAFVTGQFRINRTRGIGIGVEVPPEFYSNDLPAIIHFEGDEVCFSVHKQLD